MDIPQTQTSATRIRTLYRLSVASATLPSSASAGPTSPLCSIRAPPLEFLAVLQWAQTSPVPPMTTPPEPHSRRSFARPSFAPTCRHPPESVSSYHHLRKKLPNRLCAGQRYNLRIADILALSPILGLSGERDSHHPAPVRGSARSCHTRTLTPRTNVVEDHSS